MKKATNYKDKVLNFKNDEFWEELRIICEEVGFPYSTIKMFKLTCGLNYCIEQIILDIYISRNPINSSIRNRLRLLHKVTRLHDLPWLNEKLKSCKNWEKSSLEEQRKELIDKIFEKESE